MRNPVTHSTGLLMPAKLLVMLVFVCVLSIWTFDFAHAAGDTLGPNEELRSGQWLTTADGRYSLVMQDDGNLVLYHTYKEALWASWTVGTGADRLVMQGDGNLVLYTSDYRPVWATYTFAANSVLSLQNDGNLVVYAPGSVAVWHTWTFSRDVECTIVIGGNGNSETYTKAVSRNKPVNRELVAVTPSEFIRSTSGPCIFAVYSEENFTGRSVTLGTDLSTTIRAGVDGIENRERGGGETWPIRSIRFILPLNRCELRIGGNGVRMTYYPGVYESVPAMNRISWFHGDTAQDDGFGCTLSLYDRPDFSHNTPRTHRGAQPYTYPFDVAGGSAYDPGFRSRSIELEYRCNCGYRPSF
ncbi:MAG: hypothetical protein R2932_41360 [Caldilineaceae bacterium]